MYSSYSFVTSKSGSATVASAAFFDFFAAPPAAAKDRIGLKEEGEEVEEMIEVEEEGRDERTEMRLEAAATEDEEEEAHVVRMRGI